MSNYHNKIITAMAYGICLLFSANAVAAPVENGNIGFGKDFMIRHERYVVGSVLVSRQVPLDIRIKEILSYNNIKSIDEYAIWLGDNIKYKREENRKDEWAMPLETLKNEYGDCEDFAILNKELLDLLGYKTKALTLVRFLNNHAICAFMEDGYYAYLDNANLVRTKAKTIHQLAGYLLLRYTCAAIGEMDLDTKRWNILYKRSEFMPRLQK